jgi:hypothetical protein
LDPEGFGVYELADMDKEIVYIGCGFFKVKLLYDYNTQRCPLTRFYRFMMTKTNDECQSQEQKLLGEYKDRHGRVPIYNERRFSPKISI